MAADTVTTKRRSSLHNHEPRAGLRGLSTLAFALALVCPHVALGADEQESNADKAKAEAEKDGDNEFRNPVLSLDPSAPQAGSLPGGMSPAYGKEAQSMGDWRFDFHGQFTMPMNAGINTRADQQPGESDLVMHSPPVVPGDKDTFSYTNAIPLPRAQMNLSYGNSMVTGTISIVAEQTSISTGFMDPSTQLGVNDVFLDIRLPLSDAAVLDVYAGAFSGRYGTAGEYDEGRYGTPLIARTNGVGEAISAVLLPHRDWTILLEQGLLGQSNKAPADLTPEAWNDFADAGAGTSFVTHIHGGLSYKKHATLGLHYLHAWSQDDQATGRLAPDGSISVAATDLRFNLGRFGHVYSALSHTGANNARTVSRVISVMNTDGGAGLMQNYLGTDSGGNGQLLTIGGQYDLSVGKLVSYPVPFAGDGPDLFVSLFAVATHVSSDEAAYDNIWKFKRGVEATYSLLKWFAAGARFDQVDPDMANTKKSFMTISPRLIFRTDWQATDQVVLQYSRFVNGSQTTVRTGMPPKEDPTIVPDENVVSLSASMWW